MTYTHGQGGIVASPSDITRRKVVAGLGLGALATALAAAGWTVEMQAQDATPAAPPMPMEELNSVVVLYNQPEDPVIFQDRLMNEYVPLVSQMPGIQDFIVQRGLITREGTPGDVYQVGTFVWESQADMEAALATEVGQAAVAETANLATGGFSAYFAHVEFVALSSASDASPPA